MRPRAEARGNGNIPDAIYAVPLASMRPRAEARGHRGARSRIPCGTGSFNEASRRSARKLWIFFRGTFERLSFNEASRRSARKLRAAEDEGFLQAMLQ